MKPPVQILFIPQGSFDIIVLCVLFRVFEMISLYFVADNHLTDKPSSGLKFLATKPPPLLWHSFHVSEKPR